MEYTLHKLPEGFIITSDKKTNIGDTCTSDKNIIDIGKIHNQWSMFKPTTQEHLDMLKSCMKVIAQQDQIDFSDLKEKEQKEIGWFDIEKLAHNNAVELWMPEDHDYYTGHVLGYKQGSQKAQKLLSEKKFTLEDFYKFLDLHTDSAPIEYLKREATKFLSQPKSWKVELEIDSVHTDHVEGGFEYFPKLTNGKVKILKLLKK